MDEVKRRGLVGLAPRRKRAGYTQESFSSMLGVNRTQLANWESGLVWPSASFLPKMADLLCCTIDDLYSDPDPIVAQEREEDHAG